MEGFIGAQSSQLMAWEGNFTQVHNCNPVADMLDNTQVMGDEQVGHIHLFLDIRL